MSDAPIDLLTGRVFAELAAAVRRASPRVVAVWIDATRQAMPAADQMTFGQLRDNLPAVIEQTARAMESDRKAEARLMGQLTAEHAVQRFNLQVDLRELLQEYAILRPVFFHEVGAQLGRPLSTDEINAINVSLDLNVREAVLVFVEHQDQELKAANDAQSKYLSFLSHDLRGGLNGVFLMIEVLKRQLSEEAHLAETVNDLDHMRRSLLETVATMDRFLHAERFRKGQVQLKPAAVRVAQLLAEIAAHFSYQAKEKGLDIQLNTPEDLTITSDRELLTLVLQNLLSNAVKYTDAGVIVLGAELRDGGCRMWVRDSGPGIAPEKLEQVFAPFSRGETHGQPGVGLGLSIAQQAAGFLGATLSVESRLGAGSTFSLQLPHG